MIDYDSSKVSSYLITQPVMAESGTNTLTEIATALKSLSAEAVVAAGRTQETPGAVRPGRALRPNHL